jgi:hypothetical protein
MRIAGSVVGLVAVVIATGCMSKEDRVRQVIERTVEQCRSAQGDFFEVSLFDGGRRTVLRQACLEELETPQIRSEFTAAVNTGPLVWLAGVDKLSSAWVLTGVEWEDFDRARRLRADADATADVLERAEGYLASAQKTFPASDWLWSERMKNLLELRQKSRASDDPAPATIGPAAQAYYEELLAHAGQNAKPDLAARARVMVIDHLRQYQRRQQMGLDAIGSQDEWLIKSAQEALKEGKRDEAAAIERDLAERRARAETDRVVLNERIETIKTNVCKEVEGLPSSGIEDDELRSRIAELKGGISCGSPKAEP